MRVLFLACLLATLLACSIRAEMTPSQTPLRLCGREFLRAIIYTCGGSRWRRNLNEISTHDAELEDTQIVRKSLDTVLPTLCCMVGCRRNDLSSMC